MEVEDVSLTRIPLNFNGRFLNQKMNDFSR